MKKRDALPFMLQCHLSTWDKIAAVVKMGRREVHEMREEYRRWRGDDDGRRKLHRTLTCLRRYLDMLKEGHTPETAGDKLFPCWPGSPDAWKIVRSWSRGATGSPFIGDNDAGFFRVVRFYDRLLEAMSPPSARMQAHKGVAAFKSATRGPKP